MLKQIGTVPHIFFIHRKNRPAFIGRFFIGLMDFNAISFFLGGGSELFIISVLRLAMVSLINHMHQLWNLLF